MTINMTTFTYPVELSVTEQPIKLTISNLMYQAQGSGTSGVSSVNAKTGNVVLTAADVGADVAGSASVLRNELLPQIDAKADAAATSTALATKATVTQLNEVKALAETNQLNIGTKVDQVDFDSLSANVTTQAQTLLTKADIAALTTLAQLVDTKADQSYVVSEIARITGNAPAALDTLAEIAEQLGNDQTQINNLLDQIGKRVRFDAAQALTAPQQTQARDNINAEAKGVAASLVSSVTAASIGAATAAQGTKADSALQSGDVAPVALSGSFSDLVNKSSLFNLVYSAYAIGSNVAVSASDTLGQMLSKLQAQITQAKTDINSKEPTIVAGASGQYWDGTKTWKVLPSGGLSNLTEVVSRTSPNDTRPVVGIAAALGDANIDLVLSPKGYGAIVAQIPNGAASGGNKRGTYAIDLQMGRANSSQIAAGEYSFTVGYGNTASGSYAYAIGNRNTASGSYAYAIGNQNIASGSYAYAMGNQNTISGNYSLAMGTLCTVSQACALAVGYYAITRTYASFSLGVSNGTQTHIAPLAVTTTNETTVSLTYPVLVNSLRDLKGRLIAKNSNNTEFAVWDIAAILTCGSSTSSHTFLGTPSATSVASTSGASSWTASLSIDSTGFKINIIGAASTSINWLATLYVQELY